MSHESLQKRKMMPRESEPSISKASRSETTKIRTRDRLEEAERRLAEITSTRTRENLRLVEEKIAREQAKVTSNQTMAVFRRKQAMLQQMLEKNKNVDVVFVLDCTGSMSGYIDGIKNQIKDIIDQVSRVYENRIRVGFVGYRDHCDGPLRINSLQLSGDVSAFSAFLNNVFAIGGGDAPEDVLGGLEAAVNMAWSPDSASKVIFHVGDSPQHGARFHDFGPNADNSYYGADPRGVVPEDIFRRMKDLGVRYVFGRVNTGTDKMFAEFLRIGGTEMVKKVDMSNPNLLKRQAVASIEATIEDSLAATVNMVRLEGISHGNKTLKNFRISKTEPGSLKESHLEPQKEVHWLECTINAQDNIRDIKEKIGSIDHKWSNKMVKKALQPFAEGTQRISYHGMRMDYNEGADHERIVLKEFKHTGSGRDRRSDYMEIMETQCVAAFMASEFNKVAPSGSKRISFLDVSVVQVHDREGAASYYNVEPLLPDYSNFKKWNNNTGAVNIDEQLIQAFSHWTHDVTGGFLVVVDLQGVERSNEFGLTDPCINCKEPRFGNTNMGDVGIDEFFRTHKCNQICKQMGLNEITWLKRAKKAILGY